MNTLSDIPSDILVDAVLAAMPARKLVALSSTNRRWRDFVTAVGGPCEILWQRRAAADFRFPVHTTGRRTGWYGLYARLASGGAFVWGSIGNGRLGLPSHNYGSIPRPIRNRLYRGGLPVPTRIRLPGPPAILAAGGWSFHALTTSGDVISWGEMQPAAFRNPGRALRDSRNTLAPQVLPQMDEIGPVQQIVAGREHVVLLGEDGAVWQFQAVGRVAQLSDANDQWGSHSRNNTARAPRIVSIHAGWAFSALLTANHDAFVWWSLAQEEVDAAARAAGEDTPGFDPATQGVSFPLQVRSLKLPDLPNEEEQPDRIIRLACGDEFVVALSEAGKVFYLDISSPTEDADRAFETLENDCLTGRRQWTHLERFSHAGSEAATGAPTEMTHVSAHFNTFAAYSVPSTAADHGSDVVLGKKGSSEPQIIPELQNIGVIQLAHGDYHNLAMTSSGRILSWGAYSSGALGLGHPDIPGTPLSAPPPAPSASDPSAVTADPAPPGSFLQRARTFLPPMPPLLGDNLAPARPAPPPARVLNPPERVDTPTEVVLADARGRRRFVYAVTAGGWHSGCLAVDLEEGEIEPAAGGEGSRAEPATNGDAPPEEEEESTIETAFGTTGRGDPAADARTGMGPGRGREAEADAEEGTGEGPFAAWRMGPMRIGFAGRGRGAPRGAGAGSGLVRGAENPFRTVRGGPAPDAES